MKNLNSALQAITQLNTSAHGSSIMHKLHPLAKLLLTIMYIAMLMSFGKYQIFALAGMSIYLFIGFHLSQLSFKEGLWRLRLILPLVSMVGLANPFFDSHNFFVGGWTINAGWISFITLMLKGIFAVMSSYLLIATTTIEQICYALRLLHLPKILVTQFLLTYRYLTLLLEQAETISQAYALRAPKQKGIHFKAWGTLAGHLLLRSIDRANVLYDSMLLRGYHGEFYYGGTFAAWSKKDWRYLLSMCLLLLLLRLLPWSLLYTKLLGGKVL